MTISSDIDLFDVIFTSGGIGLCQELLAERAAAVVMLSGVILQVKEKKRAGGLRWRWLRY